MPNFLVDPPNPTIWRYGTWPQFQTIAAEGHEIASHTLNHYFLTSLPIGDTVTESTITYELYHSKKKIEERILQQKCVTLVYPYSDRNTLVDSIASIFYEAGRNAGIEPNHFSLSSYYDLNSYVVHFSLPRTSFTDDLDELYSFMNWTHNSIFARTWGVMMLHDVVPFAELGNIISSTYEPITSEWLSMYCDWLKLRSDNKEVWVETVGNIVRYMKERDNYSLQVILANDNQIKLEMTDNLYDEIYNYPLSVYVSVPQNWSNALLSQSSRIDTLNVISTDSGKVILGNIIPDGGEVTIAKLLITSVDDIVEQPLSFQLYQNYPNPFNPSTIIKYEIPSVISTEGRNLNIKLSVYDVLGNEIITLVEGQKFSGQYEVEFDASNLSSGVYFYQLKTESLIQTKKMILSK